MAISGVKSCEFITLHYTYAYKMYSFLLTIQDRPNGVWQLGQPTFAHPGLRGVLALSQHPGGPYGDFVRLAG